jgi:hypothetical protein
MLVRVRLLAAISAAQRKGVVVWTSTTTKSWMRTKLFT